MEGLGRLFDVGVAWAPVDLDGADGATGKRISMVGCKGITFLMACGTGPATFSLDVTQHTAYTGGTTADLDPTGSSTSKGITRWWYKSEAALDNDESWVEGTQTEASEITLDAIGTVQKLVAVYIDATWLADGYTHISVNAVSANGTAHLSAGLYIRHDLLDQRVPSLLGNLLNPGAANA